MRPSEPGSYGLQQPSWLAVCCAVISDGVRFVSFVCGFVGVWVSGLLLDRQSSGRGSGQCVV